jgi:iron-sulfur cluster repair protein YtfE (RIC family)
MIAEGVSAQLARIEQHHEDLRALLPRLADAVTALELHGDPRQMKAALPGLRSACEEHFLLEETLARERVGPDAAPLLRLFAEHRDLRRRLANLEALLDDAGHALAYDDLWREATEVLRGLYCHLCRQKTSPTPLVGEPECGTGGPPAPSPLRCGR